MTHPARRLCMLVALTLVATRVSHFRSGETKREIFDCAAGITSDVRYPPGNYPVRGIFGGHISKKIPFSLSP